MPEATCYILDGKKPVPCNDMTVWQKFMDDVPGRTVAFDVVGECQILTTFIGANIGTPESPKFFRMTIVGANEGDPPICSESWKRAEAKHKAMVRAASQMSAFLEKDIDSRNSGYRFVDCAVLADEVRFLMESEEVAIQAHSKKVENWFREGRTLIFRPPFRKNSAADCD